MTNFFATSALVAATIIAAPAAANTVLLNYDGKDAEVKDTSRTYDIFNLGPDAGQQYPSVVRLIDKVAIIDEVEDIGPFTADGRADFRIRSSEGEGDKLGFGSIDALNPSNRPMFEVFAVREEGGPMDDYFQMMESYGIPAISQRMSFATVEGEIATFGAEGNNGNVIDGSFDYYRDRLSLYRGDEGLLEEEGDSAILGFRIDVMLDEQLDDWPIQDEMLQIVCIDVNEGPEPQLNDGLYECEPEPQLLATFFGFIEVTRGSVTPGLLGVNGQLGQAAIVPTPNAVPLPASILLLGAGLGGLGAMRRRKSK